MNECVYKCAETKSIIKGIEKKDAYGWAGNN